MKSMKLAISISEKGLNEILKIYNQKAKKELETIDPAFRNFLKSKLDGITEANAKLHFELSAYETKSGHVEIIELIGIEFFDWSMFDYYRVEEVSN
jgi:hypothetical protein